MSPFSTPGKRHASESPNASTLEFEQSNSTTTVVHRQFGTLLGNESLIDIFILLHRYELDDAQLVNVRFNAVISRRLVNFCLRKIEGVRLEQTPSDDGESSGEYVAVCVMSYKLDVNKTIPAHTTDEAVALAVLLNACRSATVGCICLSGKGQLGVRFLEELVIYGLSLTANSITFRKRRLAGDVPKGLVLQAIKTLNVVTRINDLPATDWTDENLAIMRHCAEFGVALKFSGDVGVSDDELIQCVIGGHGPRTYFDMHSSRLSDQFFKRLLHTAQQNPVAAGSYRQLNFTSLQPQDKIGTEAHLRSRHNHNLFDAFKGDDNEKWTLDLAERSLLYTHYPVNSMNKTRTGP